MRKGIFATSLAAISLLALPASAASGKLVANDEPGTRVITVTSHGGNGPVTQHLTLALDKAAIVQLDTDARDVLVSNPSIVDAVVRTARRVYLLGVKTGQTNAFFFDAAGHQVLAIDIHVERDVADLTGMMKKNFPGSDIKVTALNDNVVLTGTVATSQDATRAQDLAARFATDAGKTLDPTKIVNMLKVKEGEQVMLKVRVAEMEHTIAKQFGINLSAYGQAGGLPLIAQTTMPYGLTGQALSDLSGGQIGQVCQYAAQGYTNYSANAVTGGTHGLAALCPGYTNNASGVLNALDQVGLVHILAEPNLTAVSGETAKFLAGGEFPVPVSRDQYGNVTVEFKQFGVGLSFTPVVLSPGRISLQLSTEVSELTNEGAFLLPAGETTGTNGQLIQTAALSIPALTVRRAETTVELPSGGSFAVAGLMQHTSKQVLDEFPGLGNMPVLGALFRSRDFQNDQTELVIIVSAYLVSPTTETKLASPTDGFVPATDVDTVLLGKLNTVHNDDPHGLKSAGSTNNGFIVE
jgi:pilus assembly protein CpaC